MGDRGRGGLGRVGVEGVVAGDHQVGAELDDFALVVDALLGQLALEGFARLRDVAVSFGAH